MLDSAKKEIVYGIYNCKSHRIKMCKLYKTQVPDTMFTSKFLRLAIELVLSNSTRVKKVFI